jgi:hypothetical protein
MACIRSLPETAGPRPHQIAILYIIPKAYGLWTGTRLTLPRILADQRVRALLLDLRARGFLDWQILAMLASIVAHYQVEAKAEHPFAPGMERSLQDRMSRPERSDDPPDVSIIDGSRTWGLAVHRRAPDLVGMKRLLDVRYRHSTDDIPHAPLFN